MYYISSPWCLMFMCMCMCMCMWLQAWRGEWPQLGEAHAAAIDIVQYEGEVIFIPSGWYHQVSCPVIAP